MMNWGLPRKRALRWAMASKYLPGAIEATEQWGQVLLPRRRELETLSILASYKGPVFVFFEGGPELVVRVHDDRAIPGDRFPKRPPCDQEEADRPLLGRDRDPIPRTVKNHRSVMAGAGSVQVEIVPASRLARVGVAPRVEVALALKNVSKDVVIGFDQMSKGLSRRE